MTLCHYSSISTPGSFSWTVPSRSVSGRYVSLWIYNSRHSKSMMTSSHCILLVSPSGSHHHIVSSLYLLQEAIKTINDIHSLMLLSKKKPKPQALANYYKKQALVFR